MVDLDKPDGHQASLQSRTQVGGYLDTLANAAVQVEKRLHLLLVIDNHSMNVAHVGFAVQGRSSCQLRGRIAIDVRHHVIANVFPRYLARKLLAQVGLSTSPVINSIQGFSSFVMIEIQLGSKEVKLFTREVIERDRLRDIEWR